VRVELHRGADDIGDLVEPAIVHVQSVWRTRRWTGFRPSSCVVLPVKDDIARVVQEPIAVADASGACSS